MAEAKSKSAATKKPAAAKPAAAKKTSTAKPKAAAAPKPAAVKKAAAPRKKASPGPEERYRMIEVAAYFIAERHGFIGDPKEFWAEAEAQIVKLLGE